MTASKRQNRASVRILEVPAGAALYLNTGVLIICAFSIFWVGGESLSRRFLLWRYVGPSVGLFAVGGSQLEAPKGKYISTLKYEQPENIGVEVVLHGTPLWAIGK